MRNSPEIPRLSIDQTRELREGFRGLLEKIRRNADIKTIEPTEESGIRKMTNDLFKEGKQNLKTIAEATLRHRLPSLETAK